MTYEEIKFTAEGPIAGRDLLVSYRAGPTPRAAMVDGRTQNA